MTYLPSLDTKMEELKTTTNEIVDELLALRKENKALRDTLEAVKAWGGMPFELADAVRAALKKGGEL